MSYNGQNILSLGTSNGEIHTFNLENNQLVHIKTLEPNSAFGPVRVLKFSPHSKILVSGHDVGVLEVSFFYRKSQWLKITQKVSFCNIYL